MSITLNQRPVRSTIVNAETANDIVTHITNTGSIYNKFTRPLITMLTNDKADGKYCKDNAAILFYEIVRENMNDFKKEWDCQGQYIAQATMYEAAKDLLAYYSEIIDA